MKATIRKGDKSYDREYSNNDFKQMVYELASLLISGHTIFMNNHTYAHDRLSAFLADMNSIEDVGDIYNKYLSQLAEERLKNVVNTSQEIDNFLKK